MLDLILLCLTYDFVFSTDYCNALMSFLQCMHYKYAYDDDDADDIIKHVKHTVQYTTLQYHTI